MSPTCSPVCPGIKSTMLWIFLLLGLCSCLRPYTLIIQQMNWPDAQKYCREKYTDLATVDNMEDMDQLIAAAGRFSGTVWIGLYDIWWSWKWSAPSGFDYRLPFEKWYPTEPGNPRYQWELCGALLAGYWYDYMCSIPRQFVCYNITFDNQSNTSQRTYFFINQFMTWHGAQSYCRLNHNDLGKILTQAEYNEILKVVPDQTLAFLGLYRATWTWWSDGTIHIFDYWVQGHPQGRTGDCAASLIDATNAGRLSEFDCATKFSFMCYGPSKEPPQKYIRRIKLTAQRSTVDVNDPAVTGAILTQLKQTLVKKGITTDLNITWIKKSDQKIFCKENQISA